MSKYDIGIIYNKTMKKFVLIIGIFLISLTSLSAFAFEYGYTSTGFKYVKHQHSESSYQHAWCAKYKGIEEYENKDFTRVDCLTEKYAVEFDFANKWAESIGQALHYQYMTGKKAKVVLILEDPKHEMVYYKRVKKLGRIHNFEVEYITPEILDIKDGKCQYLDCRCHKYDNKQD